MAARCPEQLDGLVKLGSAKQPTVTPSVPGKPSARNITPVPQVGQKKLSMKGPESARLAFAGNVHSGFWKESAIGKRAAGAALAIFAAAQINVERLSARG
jgi:hypothetical protein